MHLLPLVACYCGGVIELTRRLLAADAARCRSQKLKVAVSIAMARYRSPILNGCAVSVTSVGR